MIDAENGTIAFDRGAVTQRLLRSAFVDSPLARGATLTIENRGYRTYELAQPLLLDGKKVAAEIHFAAQSLSSVSVALIDKRFGTSWESWSEAKELARRDAHTRWLRAVLDGEGPRWKLPWGVVESIYDPKGGGSAIEICFEKRAR